MSNAHAAGQPDGALTPASAAAAPATPWAADPPRHDGATPAPEGGLVDVAMPAASSAVAAGTSAPGLLVHMPVNVRSAALALIAFILCLHALQWAQEIIVPILCGVMVSYALAPIVNRIERRGVHRAVAAGALLASIVGAMVWGASALSDQTDALIDTVPAVTQKIREWSSRAGTGPSTIERMQQAAEDLAATASSTPAEGAASAGAVPAAGPSRAGQAAERWPTGSAARVAVAGAPASPHRIDLRAYLLSGTLGAMALLGKLTVVFFVALFLLASGNSFRRKMVKLAGPKLSQKRVTIETLDEITEQIQRYLLVQVGVSLVVGLFTWLAFWALGLNNAGVWGVVAAVTNLIPYVGAVLVGVGSAVVALVQFGTPQMAIAVGAASFGIHTLVGNVLTPWWMGRASKMSAVAVFITVLVFGWLWGVWGLLLGVPILLVVKSVCDRVDELKPVSELLGA